MDTKTPRVLFRHVVVDAENPADPHCKAVGDLDGDGCADLLAASAAGEGLFWYRAPHWSKHRIGEGAFTTDMAVGDLDGDGHLDVVIPNERGLFWYRNPRGAGRDPADGPWEAINLGADGARMHDVELADLDGDGQLEIVTRHQSGFGKRLGDRLYLWKRQQGDRWTHRTIPCPHGEGLRVADVDGDGRPDVVIGGRWYANPGDVLAGAWSERLYMDPERFETGWTAGDVVVQTGDLNGDGRLEIVLSPAEGRGHLSYFEAPANPADPGWREQVLDAALDHAHGLGIADLDGDGHQDLVVAKMHQASAPQEIAVYWNQGNARAWEKQTVAVSGSHNIALVDLTGDGRVSIFGANWNDRSSTGGAIELWINGG